MIKFQYLWDNLKASFWFTPILILLLSICGAIGFIYLDSVLDFKPSGVLHYIFPGSANSARSILSIIAGAMIGVAGTVFSITLVALTLARSQFGSRPLRNFMYDKVNQIVLGSFVSTFVYCLLVLNSVTEDGLNKFIPEVSVLVAIVLVIINIILLIVFIHHISISIQSEKVISNISDSMTATIKKLFPDEAENNAQQKDPDLNALKKRSVFTKTIICQENGYLESIDFDELLSLSAQENIIINIYFRAGDFLVTGIEMCEIYSEDECKPELIEKINGLFLIGQVRTPLQDAEFAIHQMVEIAIRALSPGINDPFTAITCIDNLSSVMCYLTKANFPSRYCYDENDKLRLITNILSFEGMLDAAFNQIRQFSEKIPSVNIRLMEALININHVTTDKSNKEAIKRHAKIIYKSAKNNFSEALDFEDFEERYKIINGE